MVVAIVDVLEPPWKKSLSVVKLRTKVAFARELRFSRSMVCFDTMLDS